MLKLEERCIREPRGYGVDTPDEPEFDCIAHKAASICRTPQALISFVDQHRRWFSVAVGIPPSETRRMISFCTHAIRSGRTTVVADASQDVRLATNPLVKSQPGLRFYAGVPLRTGSGARLGTLSVADHRPRAIVPGQVQDLERLAQMAVAILEERRDRAVLWAEQAAAA